MRGLVGSHAKAPLEHLYLETAALPITYVLSARRMIYLQTILKRSDDEITKRVFICQRNNPSPGDWCELVMQDFIEMGLHISDEQIAGMPSDDYKTLIKEAVQEKAFKDLQNLKSGHKG